MMNLLPLRYSQGADFDAVRVELGMSVAQLARELGMRTGTVCGYISGEQQPGRTALIALQWTRDTYAARGYLKLRATV